MGGDGRFIYNTNGGASMFILTVIDSNYIPQTEDIINVSNTLVYFGSSSMTVSADRYTYWI